jgi:hypothetical protein
MTQLAIVLFEAGYTFWPVENSLSLFIPGIENDKLHTFLTGALPGVAFVITPQGDGCRVEAIA